MFRIPTWTSNCPWRSFTASCLQTLPTQHVFDAWIPSPVSSPASPVVPGVEPGAEDIRNEDAAELFRVSRINMYVHRRRNNLNASKCQDSAPCPCRQCPFSTGPLLQQRFSLLQRVYQLNCALYGQGTADDLLKFIWNISAFLITLLFCYTFSILTLLYIIYAYACPHVACLYLDAMIQCIRTSVYFSHLIID